MFPSHTQQLPPPDRAAGRFRELLLRKPSLAEVVAYERARGNLALRLPAHARRRTARVIARL